MSQRTLSIVQERLWVLERFESGNPVFHVSAALRLRGVLDPALLERSLHLVIARHEVLRTSFPARDGQPVGIVAATLRPALAILDLRALRPAAAEAELRRRILALARRPFDGERGPLVRSALLRLDRDHHVLLLTCHRLVADECSLGMIHRELAAFYQASPPPALRRQYAEYAEHQRQWLRGDGGRAEIAWWRRQLAGASAVLELPYDRPRGALPSYRGGRVTRMLEVSSDELLLAAFKTLLMRISGQYDIVVGLAISYREEEECESLIGPLANTLVLRTDLRDHRGGLGPLAARIASAVRSARAHQALPFEALVEALQPERDTSHQPICQVIFAGSDTLPPPPDLPDLTLGLIELDWGTARHDLTLATGAGKLAVDYDAELFDAVTVRRLLAHLGNLLTAAMADPEADLAELPILSEFERHQLVREWNDTRVPYPREATLHELVAAQAAATPDAVAVVDEVAQVSYRELDRRADRFARHLLGQGVGPEVRVGLCVERSVDMVVAILAILKTGGAYLPLDPGYPAERLAFMLADAGAGVLVTQERLRLAVPPEVRLVDLDRELPEPAAIPAPATTADHLAYVMYTSGSTGIPKGVSVVHRAVVRLVREANYVAMSPREVFVQLAPISFDASTLELWAPLLHGGRLAVPPPSPPSLAELGELIARRGVTTLWLTAGLFHQMVDENLAGLRGVRQLLAGGDVLSARHLRRVLRELPRTTVINGYGPTENTTFTCCQAMRVAHEVEDPVSIGRPISSTWTRVLDSQLRPVGVGVWGELCVAGDGLARGYLNRPGPTAERFVPDPHGRPGARLYRTGDVVRHRPDGRLEFAGRRDFQVKVRGFRIELGEVETALGRHPAVRESVVLALDDEDGDKRLVAFVVVTSALPPAAELRAWLRRSLPDYMLPGSFLELPSLPLTPNGKVDRRALAEQAALPASGDRFTAPRSAAEEVVTAIWAEVLGRERVGADDDFFELGGHSLLATRVLARLRTAFGVELPLQVFFDAATPGALAARLESARRQDLVHAAPPLVPVPRARRLPLSFAQQRLWFLYRYQPQSPVYNLPYIYRLRGALEPGSLAGALHEIVRRHEALRTRLIEIEGIPCQIITSPDPSPSLLPVVDLEGSTTELLRLVTAEARRPFRLADEPLLRAFLARLGDGEHALFLNIHHVVSDGWSMGLFHRELEALYEAGLRGRTSPLPEPMIQYADFAVWQRQWLQGEIWVRQLEYWRAQLEGMTAALELPKDRPRPAHPSGRGRNLEMRVPAPLTAALRSLGRSLGATLFMTLLAAFKALLSRITGEDDVAVGSVVANRSRPELEGLIGFFVNTLVLRTDLTGDPPFRQLLERVRRTTLGAYAHQDLPFEKLVEAIRPGRDAGRQPVFQVMFVLQNTPGPPLRLLGIGIEPLAVTTGTAMFDLVVSLEEEDSGLTGFIEYATELFDACSIHRFRGYFLTLLSELVADPERPAASCDLLTPAQRQQILVEWRGLPRGSLADATVHELFEVQAARTPEAVAVIRGDRRLSYGELDARADRLAHHLRALGVVSETVVGIAAERGPETVIGLLAILKAGGVYLPLDPTHPAERQAYLLRDARARVLLAREAIAGRLPAPEEHGLPVITLEGLELPPASGIAPHPAELTPNSPSPGRGEDLSGRGAQGGEVLGGGRDRCGWELRRREGESDGSHLAYVIYTSGTTGMPKGVAVSHRQVLPILDWSRHYFPLDRSVRVLQTLSPCFDFGVFELLTTLRGGGTLCFLPAAEPNDPNCYLDAVARHRLNTVHATPSFFRELLAVGRPLSDLKIVHLGGEALDRDLVRRIALAAGDGCRIYNGYGPTETSINSTIFRLRGRAWERSFRGTAVPIGRATARNLVQVLDRRGRPVPPGVAGELVIGGDGVARGYLHRPALAAERFVPDPLAERPGRRQYRSGDLVRWLGDSHLEFLGRIDHQVKIRGLRIELGEIEAALLRHPAVLEAVVQAIPEPGREGERWLVAYVVVAGEETAASELRAWLGESLPAYMVPAAIVGLEALPRTATGKVDRRALPVPDRGALAAAGFTAPRDHGEEILAGIWAEVLGRERIGIHDDFFALGGHSLLATRVISRVREVFGIELAVQKLFEAPTVARLVAVLRAATGEAQRRPVPPIHPLPRESGLPTEAVPLSFAQQRLWFIDQYYPRSPMYNLPSLVHLTGRLDRAVLERCLHEIVRRHEALRTTFESTGGRPIQVIVPSLAWPLPGVDLRGLAPADREAESRRLAAAEARQPFDLARGPLVRATALQLVGPPDGEEQVVLLTMHHIISDGWSIEVLLRELATLYRAFAADSAARIGPSPLAELAIQYADFAVWQRQWLAGEVLAAELGHWREQLAGAPQRLELSTDRPRPAVLSFAGRTLPFALPAELSVALERFSREHGATLFMSLLAGFTALLARVTGETDIVIGTPIAGRNHRQLEELIGFFVNTLVVRVDLAAAAPDRDPSYRHLLTRVRRVTLDAYEHQNLPFEQLVEELEPDRQLTTTPLFQVMFTFQSNATTRFELPGLTIRQEAGELETAKFDLGMALEETEAGVVGALEYRAALFDRSTIERWMAHFGRLLSSAVDDPEQRISALPWWSPAERHQLLIEWNDSRRQRPEATGVDELFAAAAARAPEAIAVVRGRDRLSYGELDARATRLARDLVNLGVGPESLVALVLEPSPELVVAVAAVIRIGAGYVPLDPTHPQDRLEFIAAGAGVSVVLTVQALAPRWEPRGIPVRRLDQDWPEPTGDRVPPGGPSRATPENLAYVIYTSGSTGRPKGVAVPRANLPNLIAWHRETYRLRPGDRISQIAGPAFDASVLEIWAALSAGATLCIADQETRTSPDRLISWVTAQAIDVCLLVSPMTELVMTREWPAEAVVRAVLTGGDWLRQRPPAALPFALRNHYGPTETTVLVTCGRVASVDRGEGIPDIGRPIPEVRIHLLDRKLRPVPTATPGELCVGGRCLARGYLKAPGLTAERFVPDPLGSEAGGRLYRSGDLARYRRDGTIEFLGRIDQQIKLRGFRIELGEIEAVLGRHPAVQEAVVIVREDQPGQRRLVAYAVRAGAATDVDAETLRAALRESLPDYMVPAVVTFLDALPRTATGKVNRRALPAPAATPTDRWVAPRGPLEEIVAGIWAEVLERERVGAHDDFFALGGHSLLATRVTSRLSRILDVELGPRQLFEHPTVAALAAALAKLSAAGGAAPRDPLVAVPRQAPPPLSFGQERMWFLHQLDPESIAYQAILALGYAGTLDSEALRRSFEGIVRRHEVLRTTFRIMDEQPVQVISPPAPYPMPLVDLAGLPEPARRTQRELLLRREAEQPLDLTRGPLFRCILLREGEREHVLLLRNHHIIFDGWSGAIMIRELAAFYRAFASATGAPPALPELPIQYADYASWQRRWLEGSAELRAQLTWWRDLLAPIVPNARRLAPDHPRREGGPSRVRGLSFHVDAETTGALQQLGQRSGTTPFMILLAAFQTLLYRHTRAAAVVVGTPIANRNRPEIEDLIGFFVNTLAIGVDFTGGDETAYRQLLEQVRETTLGAYAHQDLPFEKLVEVLRPDREATAQPVFQALFSFQNLPEPSLELPGLRVRTLPVEEENRGAMFELAMAMMEVGERFEGVLNYDAERFEAATATRLVSHFRRLLVEIAADPDRRIDDLPLVAEGERMEIIGAASEPEVEVGAGIEVRATVRSEMAVVKGLRERFNKRQQNLSAAQQAILAHRLRGQRRKAPAADAITPRPTEEPAPLSFAQERIWFLDQWVPGSPAYNVPCPQRLRGHLVVGALAASFDHIRRRHEVLRATFREVDGRPVTDIAPPSSQPLPLIDLTALPGPRREDEARRLTMADGQRPFDLARGPVIRTTLVRLDREDHILLLNIHHIAFDGWSLGVLFRELGRLYPALSAGRSVPALPELPIGYSDYAWWQRRWLRGEVLDRQLAYWRRQLAGAPAVLDLPTDRPRPPRQRFRGWWQEIAIPSRLCEPLIALAQPAEATLFMVILAVLQILLWRLTGQRDIVVGTLTAGRTRREIHHLIGFFVNTLALRADLGTAGGDPSFRQFLDHVRQVTMDGFAHQDLPFEGVVEALQPKREPSRNPLFQVMCVLQNVPVEHDELSELTLSAGPVVGGSARFDLTLAMVEDPSGVVGALEYSTDLFDHVTMVRFAAHFRQLLGAIVEDPERPLSALPLLSAGERRQLVWESVAPTPSPEPVPSAERAEAERVLAGIWAEVLELEEVRRDDDFFELGGRSMLAVRVIALARKAFAVPIPLQALFAEPTVAGLARWIVASAAYN